MKTSLKSRYLFGPVLSRRLGRSLGIDVVPMKTCTYNCIYCQLGRTQRQTLERREYVPTGEVLAELSGFLESGGQADYLTFSGSGEPTLHSKLGEMIAAAKRMSTIPVAVLTCGALLFDPQVRQDLALADVILPSLDAASPEKFHAINRPHGKLSLPTIIEGLTLLRKQYHGEIWLEIMLVKGLNDGAEEITLLRQAIARIKPDKVHLNTIVRPPAEAQWQPLSPAELEALRARFGPRAEIVASHAIDSELAEGNHLVARIVQLLTRHPATFEDIHGSVKCDRDRLLLLLRELTTNATLHTRCHQGKTFYVAGPYARMPEEDS